ncbi:hypothetical protein P4S72_18015 [Vibrio sp. PP-XX7]
MNKVCGSGMKAIMLAHDVIVAGSADQVAAGGMESMSNAPHLLGIRGGVRLGDTQAIDHLLRDGIDNFDGRSLRLFSEACATKYGFTREIQDACCLLNRSGVLSTRNLQAYIVDEIVAVSGHDQQVIETDEQPLHANISRIPTLSPAFKPDGTITPATASGTSVTGLLL